MTSSQVNCSVGRAGVALNFRLEDRVVDPHMPHASLVARNEVIDKYGADNLGQKKAAWNQSTWQPTASQEKVNSGSTDLLLSNTKEGMLHTTAGDHTTYRGSFATLGTTRNRTVVFEKPEVPDPWNPRTTLDKKGLKKELQDATATALKSTMGRARGLSNYTPPAARQVRAMETMRATNRAERQKMSDLEAVFGKEGAEVVAGFEGQPLKLWQKSRATKADLEAVRDLPWMEDAPGDAPSPINKAAKV
mmetsp:Transcript_47269/g.151473  ORF Transcript_47269/g.151473 Transcript_47269/m.151473 type:complete len:248 (+) Transcript_47269:51-794(+)